MIAFILYAAISFSGQSAAENETVTLLTQASDRIMDAEAAVSFTVGRCSRVYPAGALDPDLVEARASVARLGFAQLTNGLLRISSVRMAEGAEKAGEAGITIRGCAGDIADQAVDYEQRVMALEGLIRHLASRGQ